MEKIKNWFKGKKFVAIILLVVLASGYYTYLTKVSVVFQLNKTYYASSDNAAVAMKFDGDTMSAYFFNPSPDIVALRVDYQVGYRTYTKDFTGNFWSDRGIEAFALRGSDVAGRLAANCVGCALWTDGIEYYTEDDILDMEKADDIEYSFVSHFSIKGRYLRVYNFWDGDLKEWRSIPEVEAEIIRLMDSLCPPEYD